MTTPPAWSGRGGRAPWALACLAVLGSVASSLVLGRSGSGDPLTSSTVWMVVMPLALAATVGIALWCRLAVSARLARWVMGVALVAAAYWLGAAVTGTMVAADATHSLAFALIASIPAGAWTCVLAVLQCVAVVAGQEAGCLPVRRWPVALMLSAGAAMLVLAALSAPADAAAVSLLPASITASETFVVVVSALVYTWMLSLLVLPVALFVLAARSSGTARRARARIAVGALLPALVVFVCGLLAALAANGTEWGVDEGSWLAIGFALAMPLACGWLAATTREATAAETGWFTSLETALRVSLWALYVLGAIQLVGLFTPLLGGDATAGAITMALVLGVSFWPWLLLVRAAVRRFDVRTAVARAAVAAIRPGAEPPGAVCARVVSEALADPTARVLLARPGGRWATVEGDAAAPQPGAPTLAVSDATGRPLGIVEHRTRFADLRPLALALRPLFERAAWEAELREQAARVTAERSRADAAASDARRRIERDLHDGVQGRLVSLGLGLQLAREEAGDPIARDVLERAVAELQGAVTELRDLSRGSLSERLVGGGLPRAVGDLVARLPIPVDVEITRETLGETAESAAYFVIAESVTNAVKHAEAARISVIVSAGDVAGDVAGGVVTVSIADDGRGGADARTGTGLRGLAERVHAAGGHLIVSERAPHGTLVEAVLPCGS